MNASGGQPPRTPDDRWPVLRYARSSWPAALRLSLILAVLAVLAWHTPTLLLCVGRGSGRFTRAGQGSAIRRHPSRNYLSAGTSE
jgi:hypothetical protein